MNTIQASTAALLAAATLIGGCGSTDSRYGGHDYRYGTTDYRYGSTDYRYGSSQSYYATYGIVDAIEKARAGGDDNNVAGTVIGGIIGGVLGHQVGSGRGNTVATVAGAVGGAVVGHEVEQNSKARDLYRIQVRVDDGSYQTVTQDSIGGLRVGDRVRIENDRVYRY